MTKDEERQYSLNGDRTGFLYQQAREYLQTNRADLITDEHIEAWRYETGKVLPKQKGDECDLISL